MTDEPGLPMLTAWLDDQPAEAPGALLGRVMSDVAQSGQRGRWHATVATLPVFAPKVLGSVAAALVLILAAVVVFSFDRSQSIGPVQPSPTPTPSATPAQRYEIQQGFFLRLGITTADSWVPYFPSSTLFGVWSPADPAALVAVENQAKTMHAYAHGAAMFIAADITVFDNPCADPLRPVNTGHSADDMVAALTRLPVEVSGPVQATLAGYPATSLTLSAPTPRPGCDNGEFPVWQWSDSFIEYVKAGGETRVWVVDVDGTRALIVEGDYGTAAEREQMQKIFDSITLAPTAPSLPTGWPTASP